MFNYNNRLQINCHTWEKDTHELIDYDCRTLKNTNLEINSSGYIFRSKNNIDFSTDKKDNELLLEVKKDENSNYEIVVNDCKLDEDKNIKTNNNCWFIFRKTLQGQQKLRYKLNEGDIIRFGRIIARVKEIVLNKNLISNNNNKEENNINSNNLKNEIVQNTGATTNRKGVVSKINSLKISNDIRKINILKINGNQKENENTKDKDKLNLKVAQTMPLEFIQNYSNRKSKIPKLCKVCYGEEEPENPLVQPCQCSGTLKYIHLNCLKQWLNTKSCIKMESNERFMIFMVKKIESEICKAKFPDFVKHKERLYEVLDLSIDFASYCFLEILTFEKDGKRYIYIINLEKNTKLKLGRGHEANLTLNDISVSRVHCILNIENKKIFLEDNNSKFGTLCLVQNPVIKLIEDLPLQIQIGRTFLDCRIKRGFSLFSCCGVSEKPDLNYYFHQNEEQKQPNLLNMFTIKSEIDYSEEYEINEKDKLAVYEEEKNDDIINEVKTFYENGFLNGENKVKSRIKFDAEDTLAENKKTVINENDDKKMENKDNNDENNIKEKNNEIESIVLESDSESPSS